MRLLLENRFVDINKIDRFGCNSFMTAARFGRGQVMRVLAEKGIDIYNTD